MPNSSALVAAIAGRPRNRPARWIGPPYLARPFLSWVYRPLGLVCVLAFFMQSRPLVPKREIELDFIRGIAILLVLSFHYRSRNRLFSSPFVDRLQSSGWVGVDIFFVLSGFLVGGLMLKEWKATGTVDGFRFLKRRAFKIWPAYYFFLMTAAAFHVRPLRSFFWQNLINVQNYIPSSLSHTWSLAVEEHFYLSLAAVVALFAFMRWRPIVLLAGCVVTAFGVEACRAALIFSHRPFYFYTHTRIDALIMGVMLAILYHFYPEQFRMLARQRILLSLFVASAMVVLYNETDPTRQPHEMTSPFLITIVDYASAALLLLLYRPARRHWMPYRVVARIGVCSYGIYLWHVSVARPVDFVVGHLPASLAAVVSTFLPYVLAIALGVAATKLIDLPFLRLRERLVPSVVPEPPIPVA
jgi:peptidoglycan/LPS O-acetylase OafA/YrhL